MKGSGLFAFSSLLILFLISSASAWPWPPNLDFPLEKLLFRRQDNQETTSTSRTTATSATATATGTAKTSASASASASDSDSASASASATGTDSAKSSGTATGSKSGTSTGTKTTKTSTSAIDPRLPPGGISLITPAATAGAQYYKIGDYVTFSWNYTSLLVTPSAIDVLASCSVNQATYTITSNMTVEETGGVIWDTGNFPATVSQPFPVASYTLIVHDSSKDITDVPSAGHLGSYSQYIFGMYTGQPYVPLNEFKCATCSGALSIHEKQALGVILTTATITLLSFTWFANGFGVF